jgi:hypothetical protein
MIAEQDVDRTLAVLKIVWLALLGSLVVYVIVGRLVAPGLTSLLSAEAFPMLRTALYALGLITLIGAGYMRRLILAARGPSASPVQAGLSPLLQKYSSAVIASLAMSESVGIYGLVLFLLGKNTMDLYLPVGIAAAALFYFRPRREELLHLCRREEGEDAA